MTHMKTVVTVVVEKILTHIEQYLGKTLPDQVNSVYLSCLIWIKGPLLRSPLPQQQSGRSTTWFDQVSWWCYELVARQCSNLRWWHRLLRSAYLYFDLKGPNDFSLQRILHNDLSTVQDVPVCFSRISAVSTCSQSFRDFKFFVIMPYRPYYVQHIPWGCYQRLLFRHPLLPVPCSKTRNAEMPISAKRVIQTGPKSQLGGLKDSLPSPEYQLGMAVMVNIVPMLPAISDAYTNRMTLLILFNDRYLLGRSVNLAQQIIEWPELRTIRDHTVIRRKQEIDQLKCESPP